MTTSAAPMRLTDRYEQTEGDVYLSGLQALVRLPLEQTRMDRRHGRTTATMISGYEGSPLAGFDLELQRQSSLLAAHDVVVRPAVNEELAVNIVQGSQLAHTVGPVSADGVVGIWYGKAPGLDRATDALRHANLGGASAAGGAIAVVGDDAVAKSSTVPSASEMAMAEIGMPVFVPANPQEVIDFGLHAIALSRHSGLWAGLKLATNVVDGTGLVDVGQLAVRPTLDTEPGSEHRVSAKFLQPALGDLERSLATRQARALTYVKASGVNRVEGDEGARVGLIAAGITYRELRESLTTLGVDDQQLNQSGIRILKLGVVWPIDPDQIRRFAEGLTHVVVLEEKRQFVELMVKDALYDVEGRPAVVGRFDQAGKPLLRGDADLPAEVISAALAPLLEEVLALPGASRWREKATRGARRSLLPILNRTPYFCSGCPHNRSTQVPTGSLVGAGIGCSGLVSFMEPERVGEVVGFTQMGGEGMTWVGMEPFLTDRDHFIQNIGDGTYHHSGSLAVRGAVAAGSHITYKILYNSAVAMTGGQRAEGKMEVPALCRELLAEGVQQIIITTEDPSRHRRTGLPKPVSVRHRDDLIAVQEELSKVPGVTVLIHDQECATELRRKRKRGKAEAPEERIFINTRICEGCGDCGAKSNCLSVVPVDTEYGRKTQIAQGSCNLDYSCTSGDCPAFVKVTNTQKRRTKPADLESTDIANAATTALGTTTNLRLMGIGGTGVVTTAQILSTAAAQAGLLVSGLDQLGMAQKGGAVVSDIRIGPAAQSNRVARESCDVYLAFDMLVAASPGNLDVVAPGVTSAIVSTAVSPTGAMVADPSVHYPSVEETIQRISQGMVGETSRFLDAHAFTKGLFGDDQTANTFLLGVAAQCGLLPVTVDQIEAAIELNGVAVATNVQAFRRGRQWVVDPKSVERIAKVSANTAERASQARALTMAQGFSEDLRALVAARAEELIAYQDEAYARSYCDRVAQVSAREGAAIPGSTVVSHAYARHLYKLMAYKDEFEVARLALDPSFFRAVADEFGHDATITYTLHPPALRAMGMRNKLALGPWFKPAFRVLRSLRWLRGRSINPFGCGEVRRTEQNLPLEYEAAMKDALDHLQPDSLATVVQIAELPDLVRGYESLKMDNVVRYRAQLAELLAQVTGESPSPAAAAASVQ